MDQLAVDITDAGGVEVGDTVVLIGGEIVGKVNSKILT